MNLFLFQECYASFKMLIMTILKDNLCFISANRKGALSWPRTAATTVAAPTATIASAAAGGVVSHF